MKINELLKLQNRTVLPSVKRNSSQIPNPVAKYSVLQMFKAEQTLGR